ncbi:DUF6542 domain-containing protein [Geodermatophilus sp. URMC 62]|uniref:DUF6542 domain-containing protein n=1 Tax=Geodermatophilus sp. URMC 62 TaxID=3423414 RepID=UPI00406BF267
MASASTADTWRDSGVRPERSYARPQVPRPDATGPDRSMRMSRPPVPPPAPRGRPAGPERGAGHGSGRGAGRPVGDARFPARSGQRAAHPPAERSDDGRRGSRASGRAAERSSSRVAPAEDVSGSRLRGTLAVLGVFVITLAGGAVDSFFGVGLGTLTLVTLVAATAVATLLVRRRDLLTVVVSPPLVFVAVAAVNVGLAPSASLSLPTIATVLIRGFPTMAVATVVALVVAVVRLAARR